MPSVDLVFNQQATPVTGGPVQLVFGAGGNVPLPTVSIEGGGLITGLRGHIGLRNVAVARGGGRVTGLSVAIQATWDANVSRGARVGVEASWQKGVPVANALRQDWQQADTARSLTICRSQEAAHASTGVWADWEEALRARAVAQAFWQEAQSARAAVVPHWQEASRLRSSSRSHWQEGAPRRAGLETEWQEALRLRSAIRTAWQEALKVRVDLQSLFGHAGPVWIPLRSHWQEAIRPSPGVSEVVPPVKQPCYVPKVPVQLVFFDPADSSLPARLVFRCDGMRPGPEPGETIYVPLKRIYMTVHNIEAVLLPSMERVQLSGIEIESNDDGYCWTLSAKGPLHLMDQLAWANGLPQRVKVTVDGIDWIFAIDRPERSRTFGGRSVQVRGKSVTSLLGSDFMPLESWANTSGMSAHQLLIQALEFTGVEVDWRLTDWMVPAGGWSHRGTPLSAVQRVAEAAGAVVRSHRTDPVLQVVSRFPRAPWLWSSGSVDLNMPGQVMVSDGLQAVGGVAYDSVFVVGERTGSPKADVVRQGFPGTVRAQQITDVLITDIDAARQRGISVLGSAAVKYRQTITMPFLAESKLIPPGFLIEVVEPAETWRGLVRGTSVRESSPTIRQMLNVERVA